MGLRKSITIMMNKKTFIVVSGIIALSFVALASPKQDNEKKVVAHWQKGEIVLDGLLDEKVYQYNPISEFTQRDPDEGKPATEKTDVWVFYDDMYFYVSARLYDSNPDSISKILGRRDKYLRTDYFGFMIDTYLDRQNAFFFLVSPSGSIIDGQFFNDVMNDETWDGVWDYAVAFFDSGWSVEIKIPFSQLRFKSADELIWGINFYRRLNRRNEESYFVFVPKNESGYVSHFATLVGLKGIKQKQRIEVLPYVVGKAQYLVHNPFDPFYKQNQYKSSLGADVKIGLGSNITVDGTINPDFGQVEVDPAIVNLTAFEIYFQEKRPFFIEGSQILRFGSSRANYNFNLDWNNPRIFYSRRIGRSPRIKTTYQGFVDYPTETRILGAAKFSGKITRDWSINFLNAFTERTYARIYSDSVLIHQEVEPFTYYGVLRTQKEFNSGKYAVGVISTATVRNNRDPYIDSKLVRNAFSYGIDGWTYLDKNDDYILTGYLVGSYLIGSSEAITKIQQASQRYFQRPDAKKYFLDSNLTEFSGYAGRLTINKQRGNFILNSAFGFISPSFEINDLGFQTRADILNSHLVVGYQWYNPDKFSRSKVIFLGIFGTSDYEGNFTQKGLVTFGRIQLLNYHLFRFEAGFAPEVYQKELTRGGPLTKRPDAYFYSFSFKSDERKDLVIEFYLQKQSLLDGTKQINTEISFEWKPNSQINLSFAPSYEYLDNKSQWVVNIKDPFARSTYGFRYIFANLIQKTLSADIRLNWTFTPKLTLQLYTQPLFSVGKYNLFKELSEPKTYNFKFYGDEGSSIQLLTNNQYQIDPDGNGPANSFLVANPDFNIKSLRTNVVLRWEFVPGSAMYIVWTHNRENYSYPGSFSLKRDFLNLLKTESNNIFLLKINYWLDI